MQKYNPRSRLEAGTRKPLISIDRSFHFLAVARSARVFSNRTTACTSPRMAAGSTSLCFPTFWMRAISDHFLEYTKWSHCRPMCVPTLVPSSCDTTLACCSNDENHYCISNVAGTGKICTKQETFMDAKTSEGKRRRAQNARGPRVLKLRNIYRCRFCGDRKRH
jgi:hypothetical protein